MLRADFGLPGGDTAHGSYPNKGIIHREGRDEIHLTHIMRDSGCIVGGMKVAAIQEWHATIDIQS